MASADCLRSVIPVGQDRDHQEESDLRLSSLRRAEGAMGGMR